MKTEDIVRLAACAVKASEDSKRAEAHARASRVYAKSDEEDRESLEEDRPTSLSSQYDDQPFSIGKRPSGLPVSLLNVQQGMLGAATKRKSRRRSKGKAMGVPSPLLSSDEVMIVKRATSPNPSQHSGLSPFVGPHHKYSVRRKQSNCSQQTFADFTDDEERSTSPLAVAVKLQKQQKDPELSS
ncbi:unnamed protein product [Clavelina lepadiformis]|uniref:Uncharacterized protein n=1 Tax=Clavelina lepadiformis TaxID=159417 RepID=A0ABP0GK42_CLALP